MKDYIQDIPKYISKEEREKIAREFILKYNISDNNSKKIITVYFASGEKLIYDYSQEREQQILDIMKQTFNRYAPTLKEYYRRHLEREALNDSIFFTGLVLSATPLISSMFSEPGLLTTATFLTLGLGQMSLAGIDKVRFMKRYQDFTKSLLFFLNEERINFQIANNLNFTANTMNKEHQKYLVTKPDGSRGYTINSIDKMSLKELQSLVSRVDFEELCMRIHPILYDDDYNKICNSSQPENLPDDSCKKRIKQK